MSSFYIQCIVQSYLQWLKDSDYDSSCTLCKDSLDKDECVRLICYRKFIICFIILLCICGLIPCDRFHLFLTSFLCITKLFLSYNINRCIPLELFKRKRISITEKYSTWWSYMSNMLRSNISSIKFNISGCRCSTQSITPNQLGPWWIRIYTSNNIMNFLNKKMIVLINTTFFSYLKKQSKNDLKHLFNKHTINRISRKVIH